MNIVVCLKQVPDTNEVKIDPKTGTLIREGVPSIINPDDKNALEEALRLKDSTWCARNSNKHGTPTSRKSIKRSTSYGS